MNKFSKITELGKQNIEERIISEPKKNTAAEEILDTPEPAVPENKFKKLANTEEKITSSVYIDPDLHMLLKVYSKMSKVTIGSIIENEVIKLLKSKTVSDKITDHISKLDDNFGSSVWQTKKREFRSKKYITYKIHSDLHMRLVIYSAIINISMSSIIEEKVIKFVRINRIKEKFIQHLENGTI